MYHHSLACSHLDHHLPPAVELQSGSGAHITGDFPLYNMQRTVARDNIQRQHSVEHFKSYDLHTQNCLIIQNHEHRPTLGLDYSSGDT